jgi:membrane associated rhomboid family serine protease
MGLYDRDYMRDDAPGFRRRRPAAPWSPTIALLVVLVVVFLVQAAFEFRGSWWLFEHFALSLYGIQRWEIWQFLTFQFLHGGILHLVLNGITLYTFGRFMEQMMGRRKFLTLYFLSGIAGGLLQVAAKWVMGQPAGVPEIPVVGASAGIAGLLGAFILTCPDQRLILFPVPIPIRARTLLWFVLPFSILGTVFPNWFLFRGIAHAAHLGGLLAGGMFIRWLWASNGNSSLADRSPYDRVVEKRQPESPAKPDRKESAKDDFIEREVNPILDKIKAQGIHSLTDRERKILAEAHAKINK